MTDNVMIQKGFPEQLRRQAAELYDAAFSEKLSIAIPDETARIDLLEKGFDPNHSFAAMECGQLVGIAGFKTQQGAFTDGISFGLIKKRLGLVGAARAACILQFFERSAFAGHVVIDGIAVDPSMRGSGIGTQLLLSLMQYSHKKGYCSLRLDVIDTNHAAKRLYERVGFASVRTDHFPYLKWLIGFGAATLMTYDIKNGASHIDSIRHFPGR